MDSRFFADPEAVLGTLARLFAADGAAREVAILTYSAPEIIESHYDNHSTRRAATPNIKPSNTHVFWA